MFLAGMGLALTLAQSQPPAGRQEAPRTDETIPVQRGTRLSIDNFAGEVIIHTWDKDSVHVVARHQARTKVSIRPSASGLSIQASGTMGPQGSVDYGIDARSVEASTVNGNIVYEGKLVEGRRYTFGTHNGDVSLGVPENASATFTIRTYQGSFSTDLPLAGVSRADIQRGRRVVTTLGNGSADVSLETFGGSIRVRRGTAARPRGREQD